MTSIIVNAQEKARALAAMDCPDDKLLFGLPVSLKESMKTEVQYKEFLRVFLRLQTHLCTYLNSNSVQWI